MFLLEKPMMLMGKPVLFWLWCFAFIFMAVLVGNSIVRSIKKDALYKDMWQQYVGMFMLVVLTVILHIYYPFAKFSKEFLRLFGIKG